VHHFIFLSSRSTWGFFLEPSLGAFSCILSTHSAPVQEWDQKQLVAALENASLLDLQKVLKVHPIKAASSSAASPRRGRFMPVQEAVANIRLNLGYVFSSIPLHVAPIGRSLVGFCAKCPFVINYPAFPSVFG
jgi:hypothetical protein